MSPTISKMSAPNNPQNLPVALVIGASRGIGRVIALTLASPTNKPHPYLTILSSKSTSPTLPVPFPPDPNSPTSTITTVAEEIRLQGGSSLALPCDVRSTSAVTNLINTVIQRCGRLDTLIYNSGAIWWASVADTPLKRFELMQAVNPGGLYAAVAAALPYMMKTGRGRIVVVCPPIYSRFFRGKTAYAVGKVGMSVLVQGLGMDFERLRREKGEGEGLVVAGLWPAVAVESAATQRSVNGGQDVRRDLRRAEVMADAVGEILRAGVGEVNGRLLLDEDWLRERGWGDREMEAYSLVEGARPRRIMPKVLPSLEVEEQADEGRRMDSSKLRGKL